MTLLIIGAALLALLSLRVPVAFAILIVGALYTVMDPRTDLAILFQRLTSTLDSFPLLAVPLFILVGFVAERSGMASRLIDAILVLVGRVRGSLGYANVLGSFTFSWMSGSATADSAAMGSVMIPQMKRRGYQPGFAAGLTGASSMIGPLIPPSIGAVLYAVISGTSISTMFLAGVLPGVLLTVGLCVYVFIHVRRATHHARDGVGPAPERSVSPGRPVAVLARAVPVLVAPVVIIGGILGGVFTPTESAAVGAGYLLALAVLTRGLDVGALASVLRDTAMTTSRIMIIASAGGVLGYVLAREGAARAISEGLQAVSEHPLVFLLLLNLFMLVIGMFLEGTAALLIIVPIILPIAADYGVTPVQLGVIVLLNLSIGLLTPPVGLVLYVLSQVGDVPFGQVVRGILPMLVPLVAVLLLVTYVPSLTEWLPALLQ